MRTAQDYLGLRPPAMREQWRSILARKPVPQGRQVDFVPVETLLCLAASLLVSHRHYGGSTSHRAAEPVPTLAGLFRRPNSSILAKMANLDGSRPNGAKHEVEVASLLLSSPGELATLYQQVILAARDVGLGADALPDFLDLEDNGTLHLLGQEELTQPCLESAVQKASRTWHQKRPDLAEQITERLLVATARVGQHRFATAVLNNHGHQCVFCGLKINILGERASRMLLASHIKPWRDSTPAERLDVRNGLAACPTHDVAFDTGLLTVNGGLRIHIKPELHASTRVDPAARAAFGRPPLADRLLLPEQATPPEPKYLAWHHKNVYRAVPVGTPTP